MKILVTGSTGFIGGRLVEDLPFEMIACGRKPSNRFENYRYSPMKTDSDFDQLVEGVDVVIHCAGKAGTWGPYQEYYDANVALTEKFLQACVRKGVKKFVQLSSPSIYFDFKDQLDIKESFLPPKFSNAYAETKYLADEKIKEYEDKIEWVALRPRFVIGRGDQNILPRLIRLQKEGLLKQVGNGTNRVSITSVENLVEAVRVLLESDSSYWKQVYNVANKEPVEFWTFVDEVLEIAKLPTDKKKVPFAIAIAAARLSSFFHKLMGTKKEPALLPVPVSVLNHSMTLNLEKLDALEYRQVCSTQESLKQFFESKNS